MLRLGLEALLGDCEDVLLEATFSNGTDTVTAALQHQPDIVLMESNIQDVNSAQATAQIVQGSKHTQVVMLSANHDLESINRAHSAGAVSYLAKGAISNDLGSALHLINSGNAIYSKPTDAQRFPEKPTTTNSIETRLLRQANRRDRRILDGVARGLTNQQIASLLHVSEGTVKARLAKIMEPLKLSNRVQLAVLVAKAGLLDQVPSAPAAPVLGQEGGQEHEHSTPRPINTSIVGLWP